MTARSKTNVRWFPVPVFLVIVALVGASTGCIVRCVGVPCYADAEATNLPPCHNEVPEESPAKQCKHSALVAPADSFAVAEPALGLLLLWGDPEGVASLAFPAPALDVPRERNSPNSSEPPKLSVVLRI